MELDEFFEYPAGSEQERQFVVDTFGKYTAIKQHYEKRKIDYIRANFTSVAEASALSDELTLIFNDIMYMEDTYADIWNAFDLI